MFLASAISNPPRASRVPRALRASRVARAVVVVRRVGAVAAFACAASLISGAASANESSGFFTGLRLVPQANEAPRGAWSFSAPGLKLGQALEFSRASDATNPLPNGTTAFGGYQFESGVSLGAALNTSASRLAVEGGALPAVNQSNVGIRFDASRWALPASTATVNVDVVSAFNYRNYLSVYGKVGVGRTDLRPGELSYIPGQPERTSLSYGVGVRYDFTQNVGLKFEVTRGTRFGLGLKTVDEPDTLNLGVRWSF